LPLVPGIEAAGTVTAIGTGVDPDLPGNRIGDPVYTRASADDMPSPQWSRPNRSSRYRPTCRWTSPPPS